MNLFSDTSKFLLINLAVDSKLLELYKSLKFV